MWLALIKEEESLRVPWSVSDFVRQYSKPHDGSESKEETLAKSDVPNPEGSFGAPLGNGVCN